MSIKKNVLSVYRGSLSQNRGTPLRITSLMHHIAVSNAFTYYTCSNDAEIEYSNSHLVLTGNKISDLRRLNRFIKDNHIDIIVFHNIPAAYYLLPLKLLNPKKKFVMEMHGFLEEELRLYGDVNWLEYNLYRSFFFLIYKCCNAITTCSETATEIMLKYNKNTHTIFGGVDLKKFNPSIQPIRSFKESPEDIVIGYSGNLRRWQGVDFLLRAFEDLLQKDDSFKLVLLLSEEPHFQVPRSTTIIGPVEHSEVGGYTAAFDILVIPRPASLINGLSFPSKLMEYLAMGKPVVGSRTSDVHKIIVDGENGFLYEPGDKEGLVNCFLKLKDSTVRDKMGRNAYATVQNKYTWEIQGEKMLNILMSLK